MQVPRTHAPNTVVCCSMDDSSTKPQWKGGFPEKSMKCKGKLPTSHATVHQLHLLNYPLIQIFGIHLVNVYHEVTQHFLEQRTRWTYSLLPNVSKSIHKEGGQERVLSLHDEKILSPKSLPKLCLGMVFKKLFYGLSLDLITLSKW